MNDYRTVAVSWMGVLAFCFCVAALVFGSTDHDESNGTYDGRPVVAPMEYTVACRSETERVRTLAETVARTESEAVAETMTEVVTITDIPEVTDALEIMSELPLRAEVQLEVERMCADRDVDPAVVVAIIYHESRYDEKVIGDSCNSYGLMQIQPRWHQARMDKLGVTDLLDGVQNVRVGIDYLDEMLHKYGGDYAIALTAYSRGHYSGFINNYAKAVLATAEVIR